MRPYPEIFGLVSARVDVLQRRNEVQPAFKLRNASLTGDHMIGAEIFSISSFTSLHLHNRIAFHRIILGFDFRSTVESLLMVLFDRNCRLEGL